MGLKFWRKKKEGKVENAKQQDAYSDRIAEIKKKWQENEKSNIDASAIKEEIESKIAQDIEKEMESQPEAKKYDLEVVGEKQPEGKDAQETGERKKYRLRIIYNRNGCVGAGHCVLSDIENFKLDKDFKAVLIGGKEQGPVKGVFYKEIETYEPHMVINAAKTCTPQVIGVIDLETGKRIAP